MLKTKFDYLTFVIFSMSASLTATAAPNPKFSKPPVPYLSVEDSLQTFQLQDGYSLEPVVVEPIIKEPVVAAFDGNGRMFVAEMRTYMQDIDGSNSHNPTSRISLHEDTDGDGEYDRHTVFIDNLVLPRMILPLRRGELLVNVTDTQDIHLYRDTDGDGVADEKKLWFEGGPRGGNLEHQQSGLIWSQDNWMYSTYNAWRLRWKGYDQPPLKEATAPNGGQWGLTQDDHGKPWFVNAGGEKGPLNFQAPIAYGAFNVKDQFDPDFATVYPIVPIPDVQGGTRRFRPDELTLNHFTATCGAEVYRGDRLPAELRGDLFFSEPVGRLIRQTKIDTKEGLTYLRNAHPENEFIRSIDPNFRVVNMNTAPDGTLYLVDMYRGIIQEGNWVREGSYLRGVVAEYGLDKNFGRGRIYRLRHKDFKPGPQPRMYDESSATLVGHLAHPNGWWRDTAQKLLIVRADSSVIGLLESMANTHASPLARAHALWTLEGLGALTPALVRSKLADKDPHVRVAALRAGETLIKGGDETLETDYRRMLSDKNPSVVIQTFLTGRLLKWKDSKELVASLAKTHESKGVRELADLIANPPKAPERAAGLSKEDLRLVRQGEEIYKELCFACHGPDGKGMQMEGAPKGVTMAPPFLGSATLTGHADAPIAVVLKGLTGPVNGKTYDALMVPMENNDDKWIAAVLSYIRNSFGNRASTVKARDVKRVRNQLKGRDVPFTIEELRSSFVSELDRRDWKLAASHNSAGTKNAIDGNPKTRWETRAHQTPGMWLTVEFPEAITISSVRLDAATSSRDYPRGYTLEVSDDGKTWSKPIAEGKGEQAVTEIDFKPLKTKHLRITQTGSVKGLFWSIHEMQIFRAAIQKPEIKKAAASARGFE
jgi:mono/diheme cytochrome c family protein/glucose/arabinose dehydrogenase